MEEYSRLNHRHRYCDSFSEHLRHSENVLVVVGAGLSAGSEIATYQGSGSSWRGHPSRELSTRSRFEKDPLLVWTYYRHRQAEILSASPNAGHIALAALAWTKKDLLTITQNVDDLSQRAGHPLDSLIPIHGSMLDLCCSNTRCDFYFKHIDWNPWDPMYPGAAVSEPPFMSSPIPLCPTCGALLRPAIVRFGDQLSSKHTDIVSRWFAEHEQVDLMLVIGCAATVSPAADYIDEAKEKGARIAVFNLFYEQQSLCLGPEDWFFPGDVTVVLPELLAFQRSHWQQQPNCAADPE